MIISARALQTAACCTTPNNPRFPGLSHVRVDPDGAVVGTDGIILFRVRDTDRWDDADFPSRDLPVSQGNPAVSVFVPAEVVSKIGKVIPKRIVIPILGCVQIGTTADGTFAAATDLETPITARLPTGDDTPKYPANVLDVIPPADRPAHVFSLSVDNLARLLCTAKAAGAKNITFHTPSEDVYYQKKGRPDSAQLVPCDLREQLRITFRGSGVEVDGCVMPIQVDRS